MDVSIKKMTTGYPKARRQRISPATGYQPMLHCSPSAEAYLNGIQCDPFLIKLLKTEN